MTMPLRSQPIPVNWIRNYLIKIWISCHGQNQLDMPKAIDRMSTGRMEHLKLQDKTLIEWTLIICFLVWTGPIINFFLVATGDINYLILTNVTWIVLHKWEWFILNQRSRVRALGMQKIMLGSSATPECIL